MTTTPWLPNTPLARNWPEAAERAQRYLLALYDAGEPLTVREVVARMSEPMSRDDAEAAQKRLWGAGATVLAPDGHPRRMSLTARGIAWAMEAIEHGAGY